MGDFLPRVVFADADVPQAHPQLGAYRTGGYTPPDGPEQGHQGGRSKPGGREHTRMDGSDSGAKARVYPRPRPVRTADDPRWCQAQAERRTSKTLSQVFPVTKMRFLTAS